MISVGAIVVICVVGLCIMCCCVPILCPRVCDRCEQAERQQHDSPYSRSERDDPPRQRHVQHDSLYVVSRSEMVDAPRQQVNHASPYVISRSERVDAPRLQTTTSVQADNRAFQSEEPPPPSYEEAIKMTPLFGTGQDSHC